MTHLTFPVLIIFVITMMMGGVHAEEEVLWEASGRLEPGERIYAQHRNCMLVIQNDGNLIVKRRIRGLNDEEDKWKPSWTSGSQPYQAYFAVDFYDGNLEIQDEDDPEFPIVWSANVANGSGSGIAELVIDGACRLKIKRNGIDVWENIKTSPFEAGQVLQKGEMFRMSNSFGQFHSISYPFTLDYVLMVQHDCNLVQFLGTDMADRGSVVWSSNTPRPDADDCYLYLDKGRVALYEGTFDNTLGFEAERPGKYWSTPSSWFDTSFYSDEIQESYEILLNTDGTVFHWRSKPERTCGVQPYVPEGTSCDEMRSGTSTNSYWDNDAFLCRLNERPCDTSSATYLLVNDGGELHMDLGGDSGSLNFESGSNGRGVNEVWVVFADKEGKPATAEWKSCVRFQAEGREYVSSTEGYVEGFSVTLTGWDVNDYKYASLVCCEPQDDNSRFYLIIDGVLVDSCPKSVIESCLRC